MRRALLATLLLTLPLAGCTVLPEHEEKPHEGRATGYTPTNAFLKVDVREEDGRLTLFAFDRRDWYTAELARRVDAREVEELTVYGKARQTLGEVSVLDVLDPTDLSALRYDRMDASPQARAQMDQEHDALLRALRDPAADAPATPIPLPSLP